MNEQGRVYMNSGSAIDTTSPFGDHITVTWARAHPCRTCGKDRYSPGPLGRGADAHDSCRGQESAWRDTASALRNSPAMEAAWTAIATAEAERDRIYQEQLVAAGLPAWMIDSAVADLYD